MCGTSASPTGAGPSAMQAVRNVSFTLGRERLGIVGESGSGKSTIGRALLKLLPTATITADRMDFHGHRPDRRLGAADARHPRRADLDDPAGPEVLAEPGAARRRPDRRGLCGAPPRAAARGAREGAGDAGGGADPRPRAGLQALSARDLGRHGAAGDDRDDAGAGAGGDHRRRADLGARRDGADEGARHPRRARARARHRADHDLATTSTSSATSATAC